MPARCPYCGNQVMPYGRYSVHVRRNATCGSCGRPVRVRGYYLALVGGLLLAAALIAFLPISGLGFRNTLLLLSVLALLALAADYSFWRWVGFEPAPEAPDAPDAGTATP